MMTFSSSQAEEKKTKYREKKNHLKKNVKKGGS